MNPYHVLVSEAMLQQTQVATVVGYFNRFIEVFPTVEDLAASDEQRVLGLWQGLGYYRRARHLHSAAVDIVKRFEGRIPGDLQALLSLPGVGRYTAGAIASLAFNVPTPVLDGNVARVLARWFNLRHSIDDPTIFAALWQVAGQLVPARRPGRFNEAMMELGALVCTPRRPLCTKCPVRMSCKARAAGTVDRVPFRRPRRPAKNVVHHVAAVIHRGQVPLEQRSDDGLWARMWQMPTFESMGTQPSTEDLEQGLQEGCGFRVAGVRPVGSFVHRTTHRTIRFHLWIAALAGRRPRAARWTWRSVGHTGNVPLAVPQQRALAMIARILSDLEEGD